MDSFRLPPVLGEAQSDQYMSVPDDTETPAGMASPGSEQYWDIHL